MTAFVRSLERTRDCIDGNDMRDIVVYLRLDCRAAWPGGDSVRSHNVHHSLSRRRHRAWSRVFTESCVRCHGASGQGTVVAPPLWGPKSFNIGAGMARYRTAALFIVPRHALR